MIEEEQEEEMDTSTSSNPIVPIPPKESLMLQGSKVGDGPPDEDSEDSADENPPQDTNIDEEELLGLATDVSVSGGHLDNSIALVIPPEEDNL